jgi:hypothetical protein
LTRIHPTAAFLLVGALVFAGLALPGVIGASLLLALAALLIAMLARTWPVTAPGPRAVRVVILGALVVAALAKALMRF